MNNIDDLAILKKCQNGIYDDFGLLYDKYIKKIYDFIYFKTTHKETAEDLTSQTFLKALEKIATFNSAKGTFSAWLYQIARNNVIDHYRAKKENLNIDDIWDLAGREDIERDIDSRENVAAVEKYLKNLKPEQRDIIIMRIWQEMPYAEMAEILGKSEDACKMTFSRAIGKLRQEMPLALFLFFLINKIY